MRSTRNRILVWLASPMGDAILCTPALLAISRHFKSSRIWFLAEPVVHEVLSPNNFNNGWLVQRQKNPFTIAKMLKKHKFTHAILFKNSFASALTVFLAGIPSRIGYAREGRGFLLTEKLYPLKLSTGKYKPFSMVDYYLDIVSRLGAQPVSRSLELLVDPQCNDNLRAKLPELENAGGPIVILVPGGAFGPSKCWQSVRFAQTADWLIANYNATVVVSVSPHPAEKKIGSEICDASRNKLINLSEIKINLGELKALFSRASLVITNDTGPRHIAIALQRKVITLFGPNDPAWTQTNYGNEIQIVGNVPCAPCTKPRCKKNRHLCMQAITVEMVCDAAKQLFDDNRKQSFIYARQKFVETSDSFFIDPDYETSFSKLGLASVDAVFSFNAARKLVKNNLANYRARLQFEINSSLTPLEICTEGSSIPREDLLLTGSTTLFLKRYERPPILVQVKNWLTHHSLKSCSFIEFEQTSYLAEAGINTPKIVSFGQEWGIFFEKRSFIITEKVPNAESLERRLPSFFNGSAQRENLKSRRNFIKGLAGFVKKLHETGYRHRDLYFSHIFYSDNGDFCLIDLARTFKPIILHRRFQIKDIAQLYYSAPAKYFSNTDRLRFYLSYIGRDAVRNSKRQQNDKKRKRFLTGRDRLINEDKVFIRKVLNKANRMAQHDMKHDRFAPFMSQRD